MVQDTVIMAVLNEQLREHALLIALPDTTRHMVFQLCVLTFVGT